MNNKQTMVSIYCTSYNQAPYLIQALEGMLMQKTSFPFQIVIHDDASTDGSVEIIKEYSALYPDIIISILEEDNVFKKEGFEGLYNIMRPYMTGKYIAYCEADDYWIDPLKLQKQVDFMELHQDCSLCGTNAFVYWDELAKAPRYFNQRAKEYTFNPVEIAKHWQLPTASIIHRRTLRDNYPNWTKAYNYWDFIMVLIACANGKVCYLPDVTCVYRCSLINKYSASNTYGNKSQKVAESHLQILQNFDDWTQNNLHIDEAIEYHKNGLKFNKLRAKNRFLPYILLPKFAFELRRQIKQQKT